MAKKAMKTIECQRVELDGVRYVILRESIFEEVCRRAKVAGAPPAHEPKLPTEELDGATLAEKLIRRRQASKLSQAELARRAGSSSGDAQSDRTWPNDPRLCDGAKTCSCHGCGRAGGQPRRP